MTRYPNHILAQFKLYCWQKYFSQNSTTYVNICNIKYPSNYIEKLSDLIYYGKVHVVSFFLYPSLIRKLVIQLTNVLFVWILLTFTFMHILHCSTSPWYVIVER